MFLSFAEILDLAIVSIMLGVIFSGFIQRPRTHLDLLRPRRALNWDDLSLAMIVTAPAVILHELAHKFVALAFGISATFQASYLGLLIGVVLKVVGSPLIFFIPGYVVIGQTTDPFIHLVTAAAGPLANLLLWGLATILLNHLTHLTQTQAIILYVTKKINIFLFFFNMIPIPPFDGGQVFASLLQLLGIL